MNFPSGGPGYPQQGSAARPNPQQPGTGGFPQPPAPVATLSAANLTVLLALAVTLLGLVNYFIAFSEDAGGAEGPITWLLGGGLLAALRVLPRGPKVLPFAALLSVLGALLAILAVVRVPSQSTVPGVVTVILILGILEALVAVAAVLFEQDVLKLPTPQQPAYGQPYGQFVQPQGPSAQQNPGGQPQAGPAGTQYGPPVTPQATVYAPQQGQFYAPPKPAEPSGQEQPPASDTSNDQQS